MRDEGNGRDGKEPPIAPQTVAQLRKARHLLREQLALALESNYPAIVNIETGRSKLRVELAERIYQFFDVPIGAILWGHAAEQKEQQ